jgi:hypothetical protein
MTEKTKTVEIPADAITVAAGPGLGGLATLLKMAPAELQPFLDQEVRAFTEALVHRLGALSTGGPALPLAQANLGVLFDEATEAAASISPQAAKKLTPAIKQIATDIAAVVDAAVRSRMVTAECETHVNHDAFLDLIQGHATVMRGVSNIATVPADFSPAENGEKVH